MTLATRYSICDPLSMTAMRRIQVQLTGGPGGLGVMTFYSADTSGLQPAVKTFVTSVVGAYFPDDVTASVPNTGDTLEDSTGAWVANWTEGTTGSVVGGNSGAWAAGVGARVVWNTAARRSNRRVRGTTFIVPAAAVVFDLNGQPSSTLVSGLTTAAAAYITALGAGTRIWSRPNNALRNNGFSSQIVSAEVPVKTTWLSTRRT